MTPTNGKPVRRVLTASLFVLAGAAAWIALSASQAGAITVADQDATTVNVGIGVANTGGNVAVGNASQNTATATQDADATTTGGTGDAVASNNANATNHSNGTANIVTGNANATGNQATNNTQQVLNADDTNGAAVIVDQTSTNVNIGVGIANTGLNLGVGNASINDSSANQDADATSSGGDAIAINDADLDNTSNGSASIITGNASALGNNAINNTIQVVDANDSDLVVADQSLTNLNFGLGFANTGLNFGFGNVSANTTTAPQTSTASGATDAIASNNVNAINSSDGDVLIGTGNANGVGNTAVNSNTQTLDADSVSRVSDPSSAATPLLLMMLFGLLFILTPVKRLGYRRQA